MRTYSLPEHFESVIRQALLRLDFSVEKPAPLSAAIEKLSRFFIQNPERATPWHENWAQAAYLAYYFPLNLARNLAVAAEGHKLGFFDGLDSAVDFGCGLGSASLALNPPRLVRGTKPLEILAVDHSRIALDLLDQFVRANPVEGSSWRFTTELAARDLPKTARRLAVFSYSLTELGAEGSVRLPDWALDCEALMLVEPSTRQDGRTLLELRARLVNAGYFPWAPCVHAGACPLQTSSERDWCHDRIRWQGPSWWAALEARLPMKNRTLTHSYLLLRKTPPPEFLRDWTRVVSDPIETKGKTKQIICQNSARQYLTWFPQRLKRDAPDLNRGELICIDGPLDPKGDERRWSDENSLHHFEEGAEA